MGQKVNPIGLRLGINRTWDSRWYADRDYSKLLHEDLELRGYLEKRLTQAGVSRVVIERPAKRARITIHTARPGVVIGKKGADIEKLRGQLARFTNSEVHLNIVEIRKPEELIGRSTIESIQSGLYYGNLAMLRQLCADVRATYFAGSPTVLIGTGGFARLFEDEGLFDAHVPELVLLGLREALLLNR